jgi:hypothetical protein
MLDLNRTPSPEREEDQGRQSKRPRGNSPSRSGETSQERLERNTRFLRTVPESSVQQAGPSVVDQSHFEIPEQMREDQEQQTPLRKRKYEWKSAESRARRSEKMKKQWEDPPFQNMQSEKMKEKWKDPAYQENGSQKMKEKWKDPAYQKKISQKMKEKWKDPAYQKKISQKMKEKWKYRAYQEDIRQKMKMKWEDPTYRAKMSEAIKKNSEKKRERILENKFKGNQAKIAAAKRLREKKQTLEMQREREEKHRQLEPSHES